MGKIQKKQESTQKSSKLEEFNQWWDKVSQDIPKVNGQRVRRTEEIKDIKAWLDSVKREDSSSQVQEEESLSQSSENLSSGKDTDEKTSSEIEQSLNSESSGNIEEINAYLEQVEREVPKVNGQRVRRNPEIKDIDAWLNSVSRKKPPKIQLNRKKKRNSKVDISNTLKEKLPQVNNFAEQTGNEVTNSFLNDCVTEELQEIIPSRILERIKLQLSSDIEEYLQNRLAWALNSICIEAKNRD